MARFAAIILAAGRATRFGANKLLTLLNGKPVLRHAVDAAIASAAAPVIVVTGHESEKINASLAQTVVELVYNSDFSTGLSSSLKCGIKAVPPNCDGAVVLLGDMPFVEATIIDQLITMFAPDTSRAIGVPVCRGEQGHPVLWGRQFFDEILALEGDRGAKALIARHNNLVYPLEVFSPGVHIDIDTPDDLHE